LPLETNGSVLAVGVLHASFNASGAMDVTPDGWQYVPAVILLTVLVAAYRALRGRPIDQPVPAPQADAAAAEVPEQPAEQR
jgi:hypothetical protein